MRRASRFIVILIVAWATLWLMPPGMRAQSGNQAALVLRHGQDDVQTACIDFDEPQISGYELLQRSGFGLQIGVQGLGSLVCSIGDTGCPASDCFCQCKGGGECVYWSYWHYLDDSWQYSQGGASVYMVDPGSVEGWSWGLGAVNQAVPPPDISFNEICQVEATNALTPSPTATQVEIFTPAPLPRQSEEAAITAVNMVPPQESAVSASAMVPEQSSQIGTEEVRDMTGILEVIAALTVVDAATMTPGPVSIVQRAKPGPADMSPSKGTKMVADPEAEPTVPLTLIGEGVVPTGGAELGGSDTTEQDARSIVGYDSLPYLVFLIIVAGLAGLLGLISFRRRHL